MMARYDIPDKRSVDPNDYDHQHRLGRMKQSWHLGVAQQTDGSQTISFDDGLTWGSIGQILGYLFGDQVSEKEQDDLFEKMFDQFKLTDRGKPLR